MVGAHSADEVVGKNVYDLIAPEDRDRFKAFNESICRGEQGSLQFDIVGLEGKRRHMETHAAPLRSPMKLHCILLLRPTFPNGSRQRTFCARVKNVSAHS